MSVSNDDKRHLFDGADTGFGARVKALRQFWGWSQQHVADRMRDRYGMGWHQTTVGNVESGERPAKVSEALALADLFGVRLDQLVYDNPDGKIDQERVDAAMAAVDRVVQFGHTEWARLREVKLRMLGEDPYEESDRG